MFTIANILTGSNLLCGVLSIVFTFSGRLEWAVAAIVLGAIFDFFDGFAARLLKQQGELGKQLDSLADVVTFGVAPAMIVFVLLILSNTLDIILANGGSISNLWLDGTTMGYSIQVWINTYLNDLVVNNMENNPFRYEGWHKFAPFFAFLIPFFSMFRLAKFNLDKRQTTGFIGLPTPANSLFFASFALMLWAGFNDDSWKSILSIALISNQILIPTVILFSILLVAEIPLFSLKFSTYSWNENQIKYIFLGLSVVLLITLQVWGLSLIILLYILLSIIRNRLTLKNKIKA
ncbi:MAG: CDP-alcohol phosphatidyltransferase family protein [Brumimicrobium sp.]|nr:CDP-alcohol phosphatidyltransferase family protein [Brumimicrobium sp.]